MNLKELNYIVTIADEGSISRAAEKLYMAQSSLSQFLQLYEACLLYTSIWERQAVPYIRPVYTIAEPCQILLILHGPGP